MTCFHQRDPHTCVDCHPELEGPPVPQPTVGRIVHYLSLGSGDGKFPPETQAAIVTGVNDDGSCHLHIFYKTGAFDMVAPFSAEPARGCWSWPPRS